MIKKYTLSLFICALVSLASYAQNKDFKPEWHIGAGFGPTFSSVDFAEGKSGGGIATKSWQQFHGGVAVRYISEKNLGLIAELNYSQQGWDQNFKDSPEYAFTHQLNYLELPILTHIYFGRKVRFIVNLGPKLSFLLNENEKMNEALANHLASGTTPSTTITHQYYRKAERKIDYALMGGLGLEFRTGIGFFSLEGRYTFGLGDIYKNSKADYFSRSANRVMSAKLTYYIKIF